MNKNIIPYYDYDDVKSYDFVEKYTGYDFDVDAEAIVYKKLYEFVNKYDDYLVKYSYWFHPKDSKAFPGGQIDFIVCKKGIGFALLEVKAGKFTQAKLEKAFRQTMKANYSLNKDINVYNIVVFPQTEIDDDIKQCYMNKNDEKDKLYILDKNDFDKWDKPEEVEMFFDEFFKDETRYRFKKTNTDKIINREFDIETYSIEMEKERIAKEQKLIDDKTKLVNIVKNSGFNTFVLRGYSGTGKTFIAMNIAKDSEKNVLFICRNSELINAISKYYNNDVKFAICDRKYTDYKFPKIGKEQVEKIVYKSSGLKRLTLYKLYLDDDKINWSDFEKLIDDNELIIIDEVQDSGYKEIKLLLDKVINNKNKQLYLVGDRKQFTYKPKREDFNNINNIIKQYRKDKQIMYLDLGDDNCRNNINIKRFVYKLIDKSCYDDHKEITGIKIMFYNKENVDIMNSKVIEWVENGKKVIAINNDVGRLNINGKYLSANYAKGCEYNEVVLIGCKKSQLLYNVENETDCQQLSQAAGRAKYDLTMIFYVENDNEREEIIDILKKNYNMNEDCFI